MLYNLCLNYKCAENFLSIILLEISIRYYFNKVFYMKKEPKNNSALHINLLFQYKL